MCEIHRLKFCKSCDVFVVVIQEDRKEASMGSWSIGHLLVILLVVLLLFGAGKIPRLMNDMAKGIKAFRQGMKEDAESENTVLLSESKILGDQLIHTTDAKDHAVRGRL